MIIFDNFGDGQSERNRSVASIPATGRRTNGVNLRHSCRFTRASLRRPRPSFNPSLRCSVSNRELNLLERELSHCEQREATASNRELSTVRNLAGSPALARDQIANLACVTRLASCGSRPLAPFLPGSAQKAECDVTPTKQTAGEFLPGATTACDRSAFHRGFFCSSEFLTETASQTEIDVTHSKQTTGEFLTGARTSISRSAQVHDPELLQAKEKRNSSTLNSAIMVTLCP